MAEIILTPLADKIIGGLGSAAVKQIASIWRVNEELDGLEATISTIRAVLLDAEKKQLHSHQVNNWLHRLGGVVDEADDLMDDINFEALHRKGMPGSEIAKEARTFCSVSNQLAFRHQIGRRIREIKKKLDSISNDKSFHLEVLHEEPKEAMKGGRETHSFVRQEDVIGRDEDREKIMKLLLDQGELGEDVSVIPIVGMGGLGKTTLAQCVFNDEKVKQQFEPRIWVCVSENFDLKLTLQQITDSTSTSSMDQLQNKLQKLLNGQMYLLVLDDVWEENREKWLRLKDLLISGSQGSRVVVTTRSKKVAENTGTLEPYQLGILDEEKSWSLFESMAFKKDEQRNSKLVDIGRSIVQRCGGVPLAIRAIGSMLYSTRLESDWSSLLEGFLELSGKNDGILPTLKLSYDNLSSHLKHCFAYCALFPKDHRFHVRDLVKLWMAQGLLNLQNPRHDQCLEDVGYGYFLDLLERSFFQEVETDEWDSVTSCKMHDLMHDLAIKVAGKKWASVSSDSEETIDKDTRHISFHFNICSPQKISILSVRARKIQTILLFDRRGWENKWEKSACDAMISKLKFIRTLDLHNSNITVLPKSIGKCKHLRYLDLSSNTKIKMLPNSIANLLNLETLKLNDCWRLEELPRDLKKLVNLRHLEIEGCSALTHMPCGLSQLTNLQILPFYKLNESSDTVPRHCGELKELMGLNKLRGELRILNLRHGKDATVEYESANLKEKQYLQSLKLEWNSNDGDIDGNEMSMEVLRPHLNIQKLSVTNYGGVNISSWLSSLTNLVELSLDKCKKCQHLVPLNELHRLKRLSIADLPCLEYINGEEDSLFSSETLTILPSLRKLYLLNLPNLKGWWREVESGGLVENSVKAATETTTTSTPSIHEEREYQRGRRLFPCLTRLTIRGCPKLSCMPLYPHLEESLCLENTSLKTMQETIEESSSINVIPTTTTTSSSSFSPLSKLTSLQLSGIEDLECLADWFKSLTSLTYLDIFNCLKFKDLSPGIQHLTSLKQLNIRGCEGLEEMLVNGSDLSVWKSLKIHCLSLTCLRLGGFHKWVALPEGIQLLTSLREFNISLCDSLITIPEWIGNLNSLESLGFHSCPKLTSLPEGIRSLTSLKSLSIWHCPILTSLPEGMRSLTSLKSLSILDCPMLLKRCKRQIGEDWPKIEHIQRLSLVPDPNEDNDQVEIEKKQVLTREKHTTYSKTLGYAILPKQVSIEKGKSMPIEGYEVELIVFKDATPLCPHIYGHLRVTCSTICLNGTQKYRCCYSASKYDFKPVLFRKWTFS